MRRPRRAPGRRTLVTITTPQSAKTPTRTSRPVANAGAVATRESASAAPPP
ncbi:hypothetical protein [Amycolatopsis sp. NPDC098790]|uniref:hypothetical protein n=1 Tax=Amycolatopsis sp. NPDC098790 TaxID=3363939 RepID=UPI0038163C24